MLRWPVVAGDTYSAQAAAQHVQHKAASMAMLQQRKRPDMGRCQLVRGAACADQPSRAAAKAVQVRRLGLSMLGGTHTHDEGVSIMVRSVQDPEPAGEARDLLSMTLTRGGVAASHWRIVYSELSEAEEQSTLLTT